MSKMPVITLSITLLFLIYRLMDIQSRVEVFVLGGAICEPLLLLPRQSIA